MFPTIGLDVSKTTLDVCVLKGKDDREFYKPQFWIRSEYLQELEGSFS